ncbi:hypothetical protein K439DRAFT_38293 [Ramaria rubella]|nr:hypothetical protein K439DRAFT_38293 [Ramaria rubella]
MHPCPCPCPPATALNDPHQSSNTHTHVIYRLPHPRTTIPPHRTPPHRTARLRPLPSHPTNYIHTPKSSVPILAPRTSRRRTEWKSAHKPRAHHRFKPASLSRTLLRVYNPYLPAYPNGVSHASTHYNSGHDTPGPPYGPSSKSSNQAPLIESSLIPASQSKPKSDSRATTQTASTMPRAQGVPSHVPFPSRFLHTPSTNPPNTRARPYPTPERNTIQVGK